MNIAVAPSPPAKRIRRSALAHRGSCDLEEPARRALLAELGPVVPSAAPWFIRENTPTAVNATSPSDPGLRVHHPDLNIIDDLLTQSATTDEQ
jgi:hypothetical protein